MPGGRPTKLTPELEAEILELIGDYGLTYTNACRCVGIAQTTFYRWRAWGKERTSGRYWEFCEKLEGAEARFQRVHLGKIRDGALNVGVEKRTVVRRKAIINEQGETVPAPDSELWTEQTTVERPPDAKLSQWLLERKWPELFRFGLVLENALPVVVHEPEAGLGAGVTLLGGQPKPAHRFGVVLEDALAVGVHTPEVELGAGVALLGSQPKPAHRFGVVLEFRRCGCTWCGWTLRRKNGDQHRDGTNDAPSHGLAVGPASTHAPSFCPLRRLDGRKRARTTPMPASMQSRATSATQVSALSASASNAARSSAVTPKFILAG